MTFLILLNVSACARSIQDDLQSSSEEAHEEQSEVKEAESVLPNSWKMDQYEEQAELLQLLDIESWEACEGIEHELSVCLTVADKELQHFLSVQDAGEEGSVILLLDQTSGERWLYRHLNRQQNRQSNWRLGSKTKKGRNNNIFLFLEGYPTIILTENNALFFAVFCLKLPLKIK